MSVTLRSDVQVTYIDGFGSDQGICQAAKVSTEGLGSVDTEAHAGLINYLMKHKHGSPFEHNSFTFLIEAPIFVWREFMRHRVGFSYNETSARYRDLEPNFYVPAEERGLERLTSAARPTFSPGTPEQRATTEYAHLRAYTVAWAMYRRMRDEGVASEVARSVLPVGIYSSAYVTCNVRSLLNFISLRTHDKDAAFVSYPQYEIEMVARKMEQFVQHLFPLTYDAYLKSGRVAP